MNNGSVHCMNVLCLNNGSDNYVCEWMYTERSNYFCNGNNDIQMFDNGRLSNQLNGACDNGPVMMKYHLTMANNQWIACSI